MIDQFKAQTKYDVFFMLTTNNLSLIDNAIIRTGRVENHIELELPDKENKINYAKQYIERANKLSDGFKYEELSDKNLELLTDKLATYADIDNEFASLTDLALDQDIAELTNEAFKNYYKVLHEEN